MEEELEKIEALLDLDDEIVVSDDEMEEGEFIPQDVPGWRSDEEIVNIEDDDVNEHVVINQKMTEVVVEGDDGGLIKKVKEDSNLVEEFFDDLEDIKPPSSPSTTTSVIF